MTRLRNVVLWALAAVLIVGAILPSIAQAKGCKDCRGHAIGVYGTYAPTVNIIRTPWGQAYEMQWPHQDPVLIIYHCNCIFDSGGSAVWCDYYKESVSGEGAGWRDEQSGGCVWRETDPGQVWCIDMTCTGSGAHIQLHPVPGT